MQLAQLLNSPVSDQIGMIAMFVASIVSLAFFMLRPKRIKAE